MGKERTAVRLSISGIVQGVGFRPFIYQLAAARGITGTVANTPSGVSIVAEGERAALDAFTADITAKKPPLSEITEITAEPERPSGFSGFTIIKSGGESARSTLISPDVSICDDCLAELFDPNDRRYGYPFINCTNCGPRYTIIDDIPYDRPKTSMKHFGMCDLCLAEYEDPSNRRFHAQPNACPECGPQVSLHDAKGKGMDCADPVTRTADLLKEGHIVAVKGLGGFHLAVDGGNEAAVKRLRERKLREEKPFAVMVKDLAEARTLARISEEEAALLTSFRRPIVLLEGRDDAGVAEAVSPKNRYLGIMLPYTPLHALIMAAGPRVLVMTSGNRSDEPIAIENHGGFADLAEIADYFLVHDRDIYLRSDDSIMRVTAGERRFIRRSRGYVPVPVFLSGDAGQVLGCGGEQKSTVCMTKGNKAFLSQHIGDLKNLSTHDFFKLTVDHMKRILHIEPEVVAHDLHPDYLSTRYAMEQEGVRRVGVQHHHAHIVSCMAENRIEGPVIGLSFDGTGYGTDGTIWGGEVLIASAEKFTRAAHMGRLAMPGGGAAVKEPWRMGISALYDAYGADLFDLPLPFLRSVEESKARFMTAMVDKKLNAPMTSSLGRLFDAVCAVAGVRNRVYFEGQGAMELEMAAEGTVDRLYDYRWELAGEGEALALPPSPIIKGVVEDILNRVPLSEISMRFHATLARMFTGLVKELSEKNTLDRVVLSGGVFQNSIFLTEMIRELSLCGLSVYTHKIVPANDGGLSLGQALVASAVVRKS